MTKKIGILFLSLVMIGTVSMTRLIAQSSSESIATEASVDAVVTIYLAADGQSTPVCSGLVVRADGYILVPYSMVRGSREIQVRFRNGETYDKAEIVSTDERRNVAILRINVGGLRYIPNGASEEAQVGSKMFVLASPAGQMVIKNDMTLNGVQMADSVPGAGKGYRLLQFDTVPGLNPAGALLLDAAGRSMGIVTTTPDVKGQNIAVPLSSVIGMIRSAAGNSVTTSSSATPYTAPAPLTAPVQTPSTIPQSTVLVPQRGVTPLSAKGPGSVVVKPTTVPEILAVSKTIYVRSRTISFKPEHLINELNKRREMSDWGFSFVDEQDLADLVLELDHVVLTWKYTFKIFSQRLGTIVATGSVVILDGSVGAPEMAARVVDKLSKAGATAVKTEVPKPSVAAVPLKSSQPQSPYKTSFAESSPGTRSEAEIRKMIENMRSKDIAVSQKARDDLSKLGASDVPALQQIFKKGKPCVRVGVGEMLVTDLDKDNKEYIPVLVELARGGNLLSLFNLEEEFMCRRSAAFLLAYSGEGIRELNKMLKDGDQWERQSAIFAFDELTETSDYPASILQPMTEAIPIIATFLTSKDKVMSEMSGEVLGQISRHSPKELTELAKKYIN